MIRKLISIALTLLLGVGAAFPQSTPPPPIAASSVTLTLSNPPGSPPTATIAISGAPGPSSSTKFYWLVANFPIGNSSPSGPFQAFNVPATLSGGNFIILNWPTVAGATSYDVLKTSTAAPPTGACACAVTGGTGLTATTVNDQANATVAYTVNTFDPNSVATRFTNENPNITGENNLGLAAIMQRQNGTVLGFETITSYQVRFLQANPFTITLNVNTDRFMIELTATNAFALQAATLPSPNNNAAAGTIGGVEVYVYSSTALAHTVTITDGGKYFNGAQRTIATFDGAIGSYMHLVSGSGVASPNIWVVLDSRGVVFS